jgi:uncharacterized protein YkwD
MIERDPAMRCPVIRALSSLAVCAGVCLVASHRPLAAADSDRTWLERLNFYRATAQLPPVTEDPALSGDVMQHARYMVMHDEVKHSQDLRRRWATPEGAAAAAVSNLAGSTRLSEPAAWAVDTWMQAPFHALGMLDPALKQVGFGMYHAEKDRLQTAAGLDVIRGRAPRVESANYPILWPADGAAVPIGTHVSEYPSPLTSCPGYRAPAGLPLIVQIGPGDETPRVTKSWLVDGRESLEHCVFDETTYRNRRDVEQRLGRSILAARDAIVLIPRHPLVPGRTYRAALEVNGRRIDWSFSVSQ